MIPSIPESPDISNQLGTAKYLHGLGRIADAEKVYRDILSQDGGNAEVIGLLAIAAHQQRDRKAAREYWRKSLATASPPWVSLRNLHNFLQALLEDGRRDEAAKVAGIDLPDWPALRLPDYRERELLLTLAKLLTVLGRTAGACRLLESVAVAMPNDSGLLYELGRMQLHRGDPSAAFKTLSAAESAVFPGHNLPLMSDLFLCAERLGSGEEARAVEGRIIAAFPVFVAPKGPGQRANILVLSHFPHVEETTRSERVLHFSGNYPSQLALVLADEFRFSSVFVTHEASRAARRKVPTPDLIINNNTNAEHLLREGGVAEQVEFAEEFGVPVVNHPRAVVLTTRDGTAQLVADLPGLVVPRTARFSKTSRTVEELISAIEGQFDYPLITRTLFNQEGTGMTRVDNSHALRDALANRVPEDFFVTSFVDSRGPTGFYRKIRAAVVGTEIILVRVDYDTNWNVHGRKSAERVAFYRSNPRLLAEEGRICADPVQVLGRPLMRSLEAIRARIPLEVFGVDFDVTTDGRLVFYEANATMNLLSTAPAEVDHPKHAEESLLSAFRRFFAGLLADRTPHSSVPRGTGG